MNIALIGSGGREHAICRKLKTSRKKPNLFCIPGNAGTAKLATNIEINFLNFNELLKVIKIYNIELVIVGPEEPLVNGIVDFLTKHRIKVFGPNKYAAKLEGSKAFMKAICKKKNIPTAAFKICNSKNDVKNFLKKNNFPIVVKADGLAAGKGVAICFDKITVNKITSEIFNGKFKSSKKLILEEFLEGEELSFFLAVDKNSFSFLGTAQDHKKVYENDKGPNTGGMGAYSPAPLYNEKLKQKILNRIVVPTLQYLKVKKNSYKGILYVGLMIKNGDPYLIEYNVRMGDPECQVIMPRIKSDILDIVYGVIENKLNKIKIKWTQQKCMTVVLCAKGYPGSYIKDMEIKNLNKSNFKYNSNVIHAGTKIKKNKIVSIGGRVLNVVSLGKDFKSIRKKIHKILKLINWKYGFYRKDIGRRVIK